MSEEDGADRFFDGDVDARKDLFGELVGIKPTPLFALIRLQELRVSNPFFGAVEGEVDGDELSSFHHVIGDVERFRYSIVRCDCSEADFFIELANSGGPEGLSEIEPTSRRRPQTCAVRSFSLAQKDFDFIVGAVARHETRNSNANS